MDYKRSKFGCLPGDIAKSLKIAMLEGKIKKPVAKSYKRDHVKKANRRFRKGNDVGT